MQLWMHLGIIHLECSYPLRNPLDPLRNHSLRIHVINLGIIHLECWCWCLRTWIVSNIDCKLVPEHF